MSYMQAAYEPLCTNSILYDMLQLCNAAAAALQCKDMQLPRHFYT